MRAGLLFDLPALMRTYPQITPWNVADLTSAELELLILNIPRG